MSILSSTGKGLSAFKDKLITPEYLKSNGWDPVPDDDERKMLYGVNFTHHTFQNVGLVPYEIAVLNVENNPERNLHNGEWCLFVHANGGINESGEWLDFDTWEPYSLFTFKTVYDLQMYMKTQKLC